MGFKGVGKLAWACSRETVGKGGKWSFVSAAEGKVGTGGGSTVWVSVTKTVSVIVAIAATTGYGGCGGEGGVV